MRPQLKSSLLKFKGGSGALLLLQLIGGVSPACADLSRASAEYLYGPETAKNDACNLALGKAKMKALANVLGESISSEELLSCAGVAGKISDYGCSLNQVTWSQIDGDIKKTVIEKTLVEVREGASACVADVEIDVEIPKEKPDPSFQLRADINQIIFRVNENFNLDIELSQPGFVAVFNWLPHESNLVVRIVPVVEDLAKSYVYLKSDPINTLKTSFPMTALWADSYTDKKKFYDEYILVVATKKKIFWLSKYSLDEFKSVLHSIPMGDKKLVKKAYQLTKN
jgi:hypothetical protein